MTCGLYDNADMLITTDTATLHLAQASDIPAIEFIVDTPSMWHGSVPKGNCIYSCRYGDVLKEMPYIHKLIYDQLYHSSRNESVRLS
jgi:ADP-heptose:LPS heptosyltransferase